MFRHDGTGHWKNQGFSTLSSCLLDKVGNTLTGPPAGSEWARSSNLGPRTPASYLGDLPWIPSHQNSGRECTLAASAFTEDGAGAASLHQAHQGLSWLPPILQATPSAQFTPVCNQHNCKLSTSALGSGGLHAPAPDALSQEDKSAHSHGDSWRKAYRGQRLQQLRPVMIPEVTEPWRNRGLFCQTIEWHQEFPRPPWIFFWVTLSPIKGPFLFSLGLFPGKACPLQGRRSGAFQGMNLLDPLCTNNPSPHPKCLLLTSI